MKKAYDFKELAKKLEAEGLVIAEDAAKKVIGHLFDWLEESAVASENKYDDLLVVVFPKVKAYALEQADKINKDV
jgi:hypothetical protein